ncbi:GNAT family N-acetyltransferase [Pseudomonas sp. NPDC089554]|uniref:GNAT family N-acetyltransferase n=1 Tax=Pseudomonas sp. NPDC089554 TaxID=3390653 RepID=UPI003D06B11A
MNYSGNGFFIRLLRQDDFSLVGDYERDNRQHLSPWEPLRGEGYFSRDSVRGRVAQQVENMEAGQSIFFLILESEGGKLLGRCNYTNMVRGIFQACNLGFSLAESAQGQGLMRQSLAVTNRYCFEQLQLHRIMANHMPRNLRSERVLDSLGFEKEGYARAYLKIAGVWEDHTLRSLINPHDAS